jgi:tRNA modification GTPase
VGKSSLLNALAGAELAIVTPIPGTTRDRVSEAIQVEGVPLHITDTAGLRQDDQTADEVERIGIGRSWGAIAGADCVLFVHDLQRAGLDAAYDAAERDIAARLPAGVAVIDVWNKADAVEGAEAGEGAYGSSAGESGQDGQALPDLAVPAVVPASEATSWVAAGPCASDPAHTAVRLSARTGAGLQALRAALLRQAGWHAMPEGLFIARERHVHALQRTASHLDAAAAHLDSPAPALDLLAEELRLCHQALGEITGAFGTEELLGEIFGRFCIGK